MRYSEWEDQDADAEAERAQQADYDRALRDLDVDAPGFVPLSHPDDRERFTTYDQHGWLDSEWQR